ncbi:hypothetical protein, partial [Fusobacterium sp.]|uniref:hypothetical protein n=1 Tax=Fusobacterium sp. TaxID=68766 RepID=UPI002623A424
EAQTLEIVHLKTYIRSYNSWGDIRGLGKAERKKMSRTIILLQKETSCTSRLIGKIKSFLKLSYFRWLFYFIKNKKENT